MASCNPALGLARGTVRVVDPAPRWPRAYRDEVARLAELIARSGLAPLCFEHIGSTAVRGLPAKPIIDMLAGHRSEVGRFEYLETLLGAGYQPRGSQGNPARELLVLGPESARTFHLNLVQTGDEIWREGLAFRYRLRASASLSQAYAALKRELAARYPTDRKAYTEAKNAFILSALRGSGLEQDASTTSPIGRPPLT
jgi:GrpB-like predicted nucleotidyltransferase (UPF0157 family)